MSDEIERAIEYIMQRYSEVNLFFIQKIVDQILKIGELSPSSINWLILMREMNADITEITRKLAEATNRSTEDVMKIYQMALNDTYTDPRFKDVLKQKPLSPDGKQKITRYVHLISLQTADAMRNYSNTTAVSKQYQDTVDRAILSVSSGLTDYRSAARDAINTLGHSGMQVSYESGYHRRLDTAIRQNIIDGVNQIAQQASLMMGEELGDAFDAVEISAHAMSAPDHEPVQGRVLSKEEFRRLQSGLPFMDVDGNSYRAIRRPIGEWNCGHIAMSFSTEYGVRRYSDRQLLDWAASNSYGCEINGKHYSLYQASQYMRRMETAIRREKDTAVAAKACNDMELRRTCQKKINRLASEYLKIAEQAGLQPQMERTSVKGFQKVKT